MGRRSTGIIRRIDSLGRITIPAELRQANNWTTSTPFEILSENNEVIIRPYSVRCALTGSDENVIYIPELRQYISKEAYDAIRQFNDQ